MSREDIHPLLAVLRLLSPASREELAALVGVDVAYLYAIGGGQRGKRISAAMAFRIEDATAQIAERFGTPVLTARVLAGCGAVEGPCTTPT